MHTTATSRAQNRPQPATLTRGHELPAAPEPGQIALRAACLTVARRGGTGPVRRILDTVDFHVVAGEIRDRHPRCRLVDSTHRGLPYRL